MEPKLTQKSPSSNFENSLRKKTPPTNRSRNSVPPKSEEDLAPKSQSDVSQKSRNDVAQKSQSDLQLRNAVSQLHDTENKITTFKSEAEQPEDKAAFKQKKKEYQANSDQLFNHLKEGPILNNPRLHEEVEDAVELRLLRMAEQIERQKKEIEDLKQVVRAKNEYISTVQGDHKKLKGSHADEQTENKKLREILREKDIEIARLQKGSNLDVQAQEVKQNIREDQVKKTPQKVVKETTRDPYDFWKTEDVQVGNPNGTKKSDPGNKLEDLVGKNNLWVDAGASENISVFQSATTEPKEPKEPKKTGAAGVNTRTKK